MEIKDNELHCKDEQKVWAIGDIHGCYDQFMEIIGSPQIGDDDVVVLIGDIIDRGPNSFKMLEWAMNNVNNGGKYLMLRGNHEQNIIEDFYALVEQRERKNRYKIKMGEEPVDYKDLPIYDLRCNYDFCEYMDRAGIITVGMAEKYIRWMEELPLYVRVTLSDKRKYVLAHAWFEGELMPDGKVRKIISDENIVWHRDMNFYHNLTEDDYRPMEEGEILIHGHTPVPIIRGHYGELANPIFRKHSINIDGGCFLEKGYGGRLIALCLNDYTILGST